MRILGENSISHTYSSYQTLHPGGATHYNLASNVSSLTLPPFSCLLSIQICSRNPLTILNPVKSKPILIGVL
jgi:hypothetical protein